MLAVYVDMYRFPITRYLLCFLKSATRTIECIARPGTGTRPGYISGTGQCRPQKKLHLRDYKSTPTRTYCAARALRALLAWPSRPIRYTRGCAKMITGRIILVLKSCHQKALRRSAEERIHPVGLSIHLLFELAWLSCIVTAHAQVSAASTAMLLLVYLASLYDVLIGCKFTVFNPFL